ncbi:MAG: hypothetical protein ABIT96_05265 [Ferruginibacter sp.]
MNTNKFLVGGIIAGIANFLLGWLIWGTLLERFFREHTPEAARGVMRDENNMIWWALIAGSLFWGFMLSYVINKAGAATVASGATVGAVVSLLSSASVNCFMYAQMNIGDTTTMLVDIIANTIVGAISGALIGWYIGRGTRTAM